MAKISKSMVFKNAVISMDDMLLTEINKDDYEEFKLMDIFTQWDGIEGVSITIKQENSFSSTEENTSGGVE